MQNAALQKQLRLRRSVLLRTAISAVALCCNGTVLSALAGGPDSRSGHSRLHYYGDARGCYWHRDNVICSRYCYWEANGRRYCHENSRLAVPAGIPGARLYPIEPRIYARPPHRRH